MSESGKVGEKVRLQVYVPRDLNKKLRHVVVEDDVSISEFITGIIERELANRTSLANDK